MGLSPSQAQNMGFRARAWESLPFPTDQFCKSENRTINSIHMREKIRDQGGYGMVKGGYRIASDS